MRQEGITMNVKKWDVAELSFKGPSEGNPFTDVVLDGYFTLDNRTLKAPGFYEADGVYKLRFMPDEEGEWTLRTESNCPALDGQTATFTCTAPAEGMHGPVEVVNTFHFAYADGTPYSEVGTTCYCWNSQPEALRKKTIETLKTAPFNKLRMCVFPKNYVYNQNNPEHFPFVGSEEEGFDLTRFDPESWKVLDWCVSNLRELGIEADIIIFHPYDKGRWGFDRMPREADDLYLRYLVARLAAYSNVWWSFANEFDFLKEKTMQDWHHYGELVSRLDPHHHLRGIHNGRIKYDHSRPWVTHASIQSSDLKMIPEWRQAFSKPVVLDECCYEGDIPNNWGNLTAEAMVDRFWDSLVQGAYCGHGETYRNDRDELWWSKGGELIGESPKRIAFYRKYLESLPNSFTPLRIGRTQYVVQLGDGSYLFYCGGERQLRSASFSDIGEGVWKATLIDAWNMTITPIEGEFTADTEIPMPGRPHCGLRLERIR